MASSPQFPDLPSLQLECVPLEEDDFLFPRPEGDLATPASLGEDIREARIGQHWMGATPTGLGGHILQASHQSVPGQHRRHGLPTQTGRAGSKNLLSAPVPWLESPESSLYAQPG